MTRLYLTAIAVFAVDQLSKYLVVMVMDLRGLGAIDVLPPFLNFRMAWNFGVNFGLFAEQDNLTRWLLVAVALAVASWVFWWVRRDGRGWAQVYAGLLIGGALGNIVDRLIHGAVADFLNMSCCGIDNPYAFNVADICIFLGAIGLVLMPPRDKTP